MSKRPGFLDKMDKARQEISSSGHLETLEKSPLNTLASRHLKEGSGELKRRAEELVNKYGDGAALPCLNIDPAEIRVGRFFNRLPQSFDETKNADFAELLEDVKRTGGNLVSGLVRPYKDDSNPKLKYELVFGERRLKACIKAGMQFKAEIAEITDAEFIHLHSTENRFRPQLSIVESALQFKSWVERRKDESGVKIPVAELANELGYSQAHYFRLQDIAKIDEGVLFSIPGVELLARRDIEPLCKAWKSADRKESIIKRSRDLDGNNFSGKEAVAYLLNEKSQSTESPSSKIVLKVPTGLSNRDALVKRLKALGAEFGIEFNIK